MNLKKVKCPECSKPVFILDDGKHIYDTDEADCPLFAPLNEEFDLWDKNPYYEVECKSGHKSMVFTKPLKIIDIPTFHKIMDDQEEIYLEKDILTCLPNKHGKIYLTYDRKKNKLVNVLSNELDSKKEVAKLNMWSKKFPSRFTTIKAIITIAPDNKIVIKRQ